MPVQSLTHQAVVCPVHKSALGEGFHCEACGKRYPVVNGVPVLINEANSVFRLADYVESLGYGGASAYAGHLDNRGGFRRIYRKVIAGLMSTESPARSFGIDDAMATIRKHLPHPQVLVIGAGDSDLGEDATYTDVAFGARVQCVADAHDLPFADQAFDACFAVAVLEHVADPYRCVEEICRVLKPKGFVYAETPFMQPVHMGAHDFTRFSYLGHRRLFRHFEQVAAGMIGGPGISTGQMLRYGIAAMTDRPLLRKWLKLIGLLLSYPLRALDYSCGQHASAFDSASGFYFLGRLVDKPLSDRDLLQLYRGG